jgi:hypothetical protein
MQKLDENMGFGSDTLDFHPEVSLTYVFKNIFVNVTVHTLHYYIKNIWVLLYYIVQCG